MDESEWLYTRRTRSVRAPMKDFGRPGLRSIEQYLALEYPGENARWVLKRWAGRVEATRKRRKRGSCSNL
ncbi:MAG: hypothetical protein WB778_05850 [Thermoplasmata archaeon]